MNAAIKLSTKRKGSYYYYFPTAQWGRRVLWEGMDGDGMRFLDHFPPGSLDGKPHDQEMRLKTRWGSFFRILGTDNLEIVGTNPVGVVFSEYSLQNPQVWSLIQPILNENGGWAIFVGTPRGRNHFYDLHNIARSNPHDWFCQTLTIDDTKAISKDVVIEQIRRGEISEAMAKQEYWCSWEYGQEGSYYASLLEQARNEGRVGIYEHEPCAPVYRFADIGNIYTFAIDVQFIQSQIRIVGEYWDNAGAGIEAFVRDMKSREWVWGPEHYAGPDLTSSNARTFQTSTTLTDALRSHGFSFRPVMQHLVKDGREAVKTLWPRMLINERGCPTFLEATIGYRAAKNNRLSTEAKPVYGEHEQESWECHPMDALRHMAIAYKFMDIGGQYLGDISARRSEDAVLEAAVAVDPWSYL